MEQNINTLTQIRYAEYSAPRGANEIDLVGTLQALLEQQINVKVATTFRFDPMIVEVADKKPEVQKLILNSYFTNLLFRYRSKRVLDITPMIYALSLDGTVEQWLGVITKHIIPYVINYRMIEIVIMGEE